MGEKEMKNTYLEQVKAEQQQVEVDLRAKRGRQQEMAVPNRAAMAAPLAPQAMAGPPADFEMAFVQSSPALAPALDVRVVGFWRWKTVIVPPNAYVVHTRRGHSDPLHIGLGISFGFNPYSDSYLVVPSAMQTILINANCICRELQGLLVQGYVQWIIGDFATAYKKLDFSDLVDPMRIVNVQLREQAEAAIKDKVATMSIDDVLSDKQPIIQELTARLRQVAEGEGDSDKGLGLRIVTVQIKEAVVSSTRLWENLQEPFRADRARIANLAKLEAESVIKAEELKHEQTRSVTEMESKSELARIRAAKEAEVFDREQAEKARRHQKEQEVTRATLLERNITLKQEQKSKRELEEATIENSIALAKANAKLEQERLEQEFARERLKLTEMLTRRDTEFHNALAQQAAQNEAKNKQAQHELDLKSAEQDIENNLSDAFLHRELIHTLPEMLEHLPKPDELRSVSIGSGTEGAGQSLVSVVGQILSLAEAFGFTRNRSMSHPIADQLAHPKVDE